MEENLFRSIPRVDELLGRDELKVSALPPVLLRESVREELDALRDEVRGGLSALPETGILCARILARAEEKQLPTLRSVINATGVTLHTNLGRACLSERAANAAAEAARDYSTLEYDVENGCRGSRYQHVEALLCRLTGAEAAMAVNNNAAAVLLILSALAGGGEVIASRGELVRQEQPVDGIGRGFGREEGQQGERGDEDHHKAHSHAHRYAFAVETREEAGSDDQQEERQKIGA